MKTFLFLFIFSSQLFSSSQVVFVLAENFNSTKAKLVTYEKTNNIFQKTSEPIDVNIGKNGLAWGYSELFTLDKKEKNLKKEGDKKAVAGVFKLSKVYGYAKNFKTNMPYIQSTKDLICVDDITNENYNKIIKTNNKKDFKSYENMLLNSEVYEYVIKIEHNSNSIKSKGSCIFMHVSNSKNTATLGCTSMQKDEIKKMITWLDIKKEPILIQVDKTSCENMKDLYSFLDCNL